MSCAVSGRSPLKYQSKSGPTSSLSSAMKPSTDTTACVITVAMPRADRPIVAERHRTQQGNAERLPYVEREAIAAQYRLRYGHLVTTMTPVCRLLHAMPRTDCDSPPVPRAASPPVGRRGAGENGRHGTAYDDSPTRRLRGAHPRHRHRRRDAVVVPRVRLLRHLLPGAARRPRRPQAGAAPDPLHDERHGPAPRPRPRQERPRRRRGDGPAAPARRRRDLRRPGPDGAALVDAAADDRRPRQLRVARRLARRRCATPSAGWRRRRWR